MYIKFNIKKWEKLDAVIVPNHWGVYKSHMYTSKVLIDEASTVSELCIEDKHEWLLWKEIMRCSGKETEAVKHKETDLYYLFKDLKINITKHYIIIKKEDKIIKNISMKDFNNNPRYTFKKIIELSSQQQSP